MLRDMAHNQSWWCEFCMACLKNSSYLNNAEETKIHKTRKMKTEQQMTNSWLLFLLIYQRLWRWPCAWVKAVLLNIFQCDFLSESFTHFVTKCSKPGTNNVAYGQSTLTVSPYKNLLLTTPCVHIVISVFQPQIQISANIGRFILHGIKKARARQVRYFHANKNKFFCGTTVYFVPVYRRLSGVHDCISMRMALHL